MGNPEDTTACADEERRLSALRAYAVLDTPPEEAFDRVTRIAAHVCRAPMALVSLVDEDRQWFKSRHGLEVSETPRRISFCTHAIRGEDVLVVPDAREDPRFRDNPLVTGGPRLRSYAGAPLATPSGDRIGTLCVLDTRTRHDLAPEDLAALRDLAAVVVDALELGAEARRRGEAERLASRQARRLNDFAEVACDWLWETDADLRLTFVSERFHRLVGVGPAEVLGRRHDELAVAEEEDGRARHLADLAARREFRDFECAFGDPEGRRWTFRVSGKPLFSATGEFLGYRGTGTDVTEAREAGRRLVERERQLTRAQEIARLGDWRFDVPTSRLEWSDTAYAMLGTARGAFDPTLRSLLERVHPDDRHVIPAAIERFAEGGGPECLEYRVVGLDGRERHVWVEARPELDRDARLVAVHGVCQDVTDRRRALEELRRAKDAAEAASRAKSSFLANMSHELRTPLNAIIGFADMIAREMLGPVGVPRYREYAGDIHRSGLHLLGLIDGVLDLARVESGAFPLDERAVDLSALVADAAHLAAAGAPERPRRIAVTGERVLVLADERAMRQILLNLLSNAIKFTDAAGSVGVQVGSDEDCVSIVVADDGIGIPAHVLSRIGEPFVQAEGAESRAHQGTGIGLFITRSLVERHGGTIAVESSEGKGTRVTVRLPASRRLDPMPGGERRGAMRGTDPDG